MSEEEKIEAEKKNKRKNRIFNTIWVIAMVLIIIFRLHPISGSSMYPTYEDGQRCLCTCLYTNIDYGDVVIAKVTSPSELIIKRVIGMPGDTVEITSDGEIYVNDVLSEYGTGSAIVEDYQFCEELELLEDGTYQIILGNNEYFLVGDNHQNSVDSRYWGPFTKKQIKQKVLFVF